MCKHFIDFIREYTVTTKETANELVDAMVEYARNMIQQKYNNKIKIPDIKEGFQKKVSSTQY